MGSYLGVTGSVWASQRPRGVIGIHTLPPITPSGEYIIYGTERGCAYKEGVQL